MAERDIVKTMQPLPGKVEHCGRSIDADHVMYERGKRLRHRSCSTAKVGNHPFVAKKSHECKQVEAEGIDEVDTVVSLLGELLYTLLVQRWAVAKVRVVSLSDNYAELRCRGEPLDLSRHTVYEVKAATFHDYLFVRDEEGGWRLRVVFDL